MKKFLAKITHHTRTLNWSRWSSLVHNHLDHPLTCTNTPKTSPSDDHWSSTATPETQGGPDLTKILDHTSWSSLVHTTLDHPLTSTNVPTSGVVQKKCLDHLTHESYTPSDLHWSAVQPGPYYVGGRHNPTATTPPRTPGRPHHTKTGCPNNTPTPVTSTPR